MCCLPVMAYALRSPSLRRVWVEMIMSVRNFVVYFVTLLAEGVG